MAMSGPPLVGCMCKKYGWTSLDSDAIDWKAHEQAFKKMRKYRSHLVKYVHGILPTNSRLNKFDGGIRRCPACASHCEDQAHIMRCSHPTRHSWRLSFLVAIEAHCQSKGTYPPMKDLLLSVLTQCIESDGPVQINEAEYPEQMYSLIRQQQQIGWTQILVGRFSTQWGFLQACYEKGDIAESRGILSHQGSFDGQWTAKMIQVIWEWWRKVWGSRNADLHGHDTTTRQQAKRLEVRRQLHNLYAQRHLLEPSVQSMLLDNAELHHIQPLFATKNWLRMNEEQFRGSIRRVKRMALRGVRSIRSYFNPREIP